MWQTLLYIPEKVAGVPMFGFGILAVVWLVGSIGLLAWLVRRQGFNEETQSYLPILLIIGVGIVFVGPWLMEPSLGLPIRGYGVMVTLGVVSGVALAAWQTRRMGLDPEVIFSLAFWMFAAGILGARAFFVIQHWSQFQKDTPWETMKAIGNIPAGGLVVYGSVIGGLAALLIYCRVRKLPVLAIGDLIAPSMLLGLAFGRIGCLLNGCCYGGSCESPLPSLTFPQFADLESRKVSEPYEHQQTLGQLHGFRLGANAQGEAVVLGVRPDSPAGMSGLAAGSVIRRIELDPFSSLFAAITVPELAGGDLEIETVSGGKINVPIETRGKPSDSAASLNKVGFELAEVSATSGLIVQAVEAGGPADRAGLQPSERLTSVRLPPIPSFAAARHVLVHVERRLLLETANGERYDISLAELPPRSQPVHPTQVYSSVKAALLALFLYSYYPFRRRDGEVFAWMLTLYPLFRILIESIRDDVPSLFDIGVKVTISQAVSGAILVVGLGLWVYLLRQPKGSVLPPSTAEESLHT